MHPDASHHAPEHTPLSSEDAPLSLHPHEEDALLPAHGATPTSAEDLPVSSSTDVTVQEESHPVTTGVGALSVGVGAMVAGAAVGGPVGAALGAVVGAAIGGKLGHEMGEAADGDDDTSPAGPSSV